MSQLTPFHASHQAAGARLVDFAGWQLPVHYGSQINEHKAVREAAGMFDVSHMTIVDVTGAGARAYLRRLLTNDVDKLAIGQALYSCLCNEAGGVIDDLIVYRREPEDGHERYRVIVNAATREKDLAWFQQHRPDSVSVDTPANLALLAVQGPDAVQRCRGAIAAVQGSMIELAALPRFASLSAGDWFVGRTGYTGEDGLEVALPAADAPAFWSALLEAGVAPCGLGARDTLRLEAGLCLYGNDLDEQHSPIESGIGWCVDVRDPARDFIGRTELAEQKEFGGRFRQIGLVLDSRGVLRGGQAVQLVGTTVGEITSGTFSPTLQQSIAVARVSRAIKGGCDVVIRNRPFPAHVVELPFVTPSN